MREEKRATKERKKEERMAAKELNILMKEVKEDMELTDHQELPVIPRYFIWRCNQERIENIIRKSSIL